MPNFPLGFLKPLTIDANISWVADSGSYNWASTGAAVLAVPAGVQAGDLLLVVDHIQQSNPASLGTIPAGSGLTLLGVQGSASATSLAIYGKVATSGDAGTVYPAGTAGTITRYMTAFRKTNGIWSVGGYSSQAAPGTNSNQTYTFNQSAQTGPLVAIGCIGNSLTTTTRTQTPSMNVIDTRSVSNSLYYCHGAYKIYPSGGNPPVSQQMTSNFASYTPAFASLYARPVSDVTYTYISQTTGINANMTMPTVQAGDIAVYTGAVTGTGSVTIPTGWTQIQAMDSSFIGARAAYRICVGNESGTSISWGSGTSRQADITIFRPSTPIVSLTVSENVLEVDEAVSDVQTVSAQTGSGLMFAYVLNCYNDGFTVAPPDTTNTGAGTKKVAFLVFSNGSVEHTFTSIRNDSFARMARGTFVLKAS